MNSPLVSIVIPMLNAERVIPACLDACLAQTHANVQVIVVDNGSTDRSRERVRARMAEASDRLELVVCMQRGPGLARNAGYTRVRGEYVAWVDADDFILPNKLEAQIAALAPFRETPAICSSEVLVERVFPDGRAIAAGAFTGLSAAEELVAAVSGRRGFPPCGYLLTRAAAQRLAESGGFLGVRCQDREYFARAWLQGIPFVHLPQVLSIYRDWSTAQVTNSLDRMLWAPALATCYASLRNVANGEATLHGEDVDRALSISWRYYAFRPFDFDSVRDVVFSVDGKRKRIALDMYERAIVLACRTQNVVFPESLATHTVRMIPTLAPAYVRLLEAATGLIDRELLEEIPAAEARKRRAALMP